jgi:hypothetical protein
MAQNTGNARNILVGASPLFISNLDITSADYLENQEPGATGDFAFESGVSYTNTLNDKDIVAGEFGYRNVGYTNNGLQVTYNPSYGSVTVDQLLDTAKLFKESMEVMIATEMAEGTLENVIAVFGQRSTGGSTISATNTLASTGGGAGALALTALDKLGLAGGALGEAPTERQLVAVGQAPTSEAPSTERVYYARRVLSVQQSQFSLARNAASTFPVTFRLLPSGRSADAGQEYGFIVDRVLVAPSA